MAKKIVDFKVYDIDYLMNAELTEEDLHNLFDTASLIGSLILEEFKLIGSKLSQNEIIKLVKDKESRWYNQFQWNMEQHEKFAKQLAKVMKNVYFLSLKRQIRQKYLFEMKHEHVCGNRPIYKQHWSMHPTMQ
jgi:hypothetical protein